MITRIGLVTEGCMGPVDCLYLSSCAVCMVSVCRVLDVVCVVEHDFNSSFDVCDSLAWVIVVMGIN